MPLFSFDHIDRNLKFLITGKLLLNLVLTVFTNNLIITLL